jgi:hypothetical protein
VAQLSAGRRRASKGGRKTIRRLMALGFGLRSPHDVHARVHSAEALGQNALAETASQSSSR